MSSGEILTVYSPDGSVVGTMSRREAEAADHMTENVLVFLFNSIGKVWIQLRPATKKHFPNCWDISTCGGVMSGESPQAAAERETFEETGLHPQLHYVETFINEFEDNNGRSWRHLSHLFIGETEQIPTPNEEVAEFACRETAEARAHALQEPDHFVPSFVFELDKGIQAYASINAR